MHNPNSVERQLNGKIKGLTNFPEEIPPRKII